MSAFSHLIRKHFYYRLCEDSSVILSTYYTLYALFVVLGVFLFFNLGRLKVL